MWQATWVLAAAVAGVVASASASARADEVPIEQQLVDDFNKLFGVHPGFRANHAKGVVLQGTFTPSPEAAALSKASHFGGGAVPLTARFSNATGLPNIHDGDPNANPHGLSLKFHLKDGSETDIVANSLHTFPVATGEDFHALLSAVAASGPDAVKPTKLDEFMAGHPAVARAFASTATPESYATEEYFGIDAFVFTNAAGAHVPVRYRFEPAAGVKHLSADAARAQSPDFLADEIAARVKAGPVAFTYLAQVAEPGDQTRDPTQPWPAERKFVPLGTVTLTSVDPDSAAAQKPLLFLPGQVTDGIDRSDDPLIEVRDGAYAVSFSRRSTP